MNTVIFLIFVFIIGINCWQINSLANDPRRHNSLLQRILQKSDAEGKWDLVKKSTAPKTGKCVEQKWHDYCYTCGQQNYNKRLYNMCCAEDAETVNFCSNFEEEEAVEDTGRIRHCF